MTSNRIEIRVPEIGMASQEIKFGGWLKKPGDFVEAGDELFELETDKATVVCEAENSGTLAEVQVEEGAVKEGGLLGYLNA